MFEMNIVYEYVSYLFVNYSEKNLYYFYSLIEKVFTIKKIIF